MARWRLRAFVLAAVAAVAFVGAVVGQPTFPALTGRVVDQASLLDAAARSRLEAKLKELEAKTTTQLVVVTLASLGGYDIADYGYQLGRHWGIGQKGTNNGALLIVAPNERKVRIEVGYGLEGTLTDAVSRLIIDQAILPRFRAKDFQGGIERGVDDIVQVLSGDAADFKQRAAERESRPSGGEGFGLFTFVLIILMIWLFIYLQRAQQQGGGRRRSRWGPAVGGIPPGGVVGRRMVVRRVRRRILRRRRIFRRWRVVRRRWIVRELVVSTGANLNEVERARIADAIRAAEVNTAGEIYVVVASEAAEFRSIPVLWAAIIALIVPWPLFLLTTLPSWTILVLQVITFVVVATAASHHKIRHRIVPPSIADAAARKAAQAQFIAHGIHLTEARTGILIYVALANRRVEIVADDGINRKVAQPELDQLAQQVVAAARSGTLADGLVNAVNDAGKLLSRHFPPTATNPNELPDRVVEI